jgi:hypothetical protein
MQTRRWILVLGVSSSIALAVGLPLTALALQRSSEVVTGHVVSVQPAERVIVVREGAGQPPHQAGEIAIHLRLGQRVRLKRGSETLDSVAPGEQIRAKVSTKADHQARWVLLI